jgi:hypothetical protein
MEKDMIEEVHSNEHLVQNWSKPCRQIARVVKENQLVVEISS